MASSDASVVRPLDPAAIRFVLCDLDGVVWLRREPLPGAADAIARLRVDGRRVLFVTNNSMSTIADQEAALAAIGVPADGDVVTSAQAAAWLVDASERVRVAGGPGVVEAVAERGAEVVTASDPLADVDVVVVGLHQEFDYDGLQAANRSIRRGARFVATNDDATYPTPDGPIPGAGSLVAAVATASERRPVIAGKPHRAMADLVAARCGPDFRPEAAIVIGDRMSTDGRFAEAIGCPFALVRTGVTGVGARVEGRVDLDVADLPAVVATLLAS